MKLKNIDGSEDNKVTTDDREIIGDANPLHTGVRQFERYEKMLKQLFYE